MLIIYFIYPRFTALKKGKKEKSSNAPACWLILHTVSRENEMCHSPRWPPDYNIRVNYCFSEAIDDHTKRSQIMRNYALHIFSEFSSFSREIRGNRKCLLGHWTQSGDVQPDPISLKCCPNQINRPIRGQSTSSLVNPLAGELGRMM